LGVAPLHAYVGLILPFHEYAAPLHATTALAQCCVAVAVVAVLGDATAFGAAGPLAVLPRAAYWAVLLLAPGAVAAVLARTPLHWLCAARRFVDRRRHYVAAAQALGVNFVAHAATDGSSVVPEDMRLQCDAVAARTPQPAVRGWDYGATIAPAPARMKRKRSVAASTTDATHSCSSGDRSSGSGPTGTNGDCVAVEVTDVVDAALKTISIADKPDARALCGLPSAATHRRVLCARTQLAAAAVAVVLAVAAVALAQAMSAPWCPAVLRTYAVHAAAALAGDAVVLQPLWVAAVALWRWLHARESALHADGAAPLLHRAYPIHRSWAV
jgi:hypothetical protein